MIDYNYYTTLSDKELEKIISHVKNIQNQRANDFSNSFKSLNINYIINLFPSVSKDLLLKNFNEFSSNYNHTPEEFEFYIFLKKNEVTKSFDFSSIENSIIWKYSNIELLEFFKKEFPDVYIKFQSSSIQLHPKELVEYYLDNGFIQTDISKLPTFSISNSLVSVLLDRNIPKSLDDLKFYRTFHQYNFETMSQIKNYFNIDSFDLKFLFNESSKTTNYDDFKDYMKNIFKYCEPEMLSLFELNTFFLEQIGKTVDKVIKETSKPFLLYTYERISKENNEKMDEYLNIIASKIQKPVNKEFFTKLKLYASLSNSLDEKSIPHKNIKI